MSKTEIIAELAHLSPEERAEVRAKLDALGNARTASPQKVAQRKAALQKLRALRGLRDLIADPVTWQRELREDLCVR